MIVFKRCKCGGESFYDEDADGTWRCEDCNRLADYEYIQDKKEKEQNND